MSDVLTAEERRLVYDDMSVDLEHLPEYIDGLKAIIDRLCAEVSRLRRLEEPGVIIVRPIAPSDGGGWTANIPAKGSGAYVGDGDTPEEALADVLALETALDAMKAKEED